MSACSSSFWKTSWPTIHFNFSNLKLTLFEWRFMTIAIHKWLQDVLTKPKYNFWQCFQNCHNFCTCTKSQWHTQEFFLWGGSTNSFEDRGQTEWGSGRGSPLVRGSTQFAKGWNPYSY
jgi:hypothetical protein